MPLFSKILIANRGEIACRVIKTAKRLSIKTVAVYSEADAAARHATMADEAVLIGPPSALESYLSIPNIIAAAKKTDADAIHPGYGFLSENADFARACEEAGITFIGPAADVIHLMGNKAAAKRYMTAAGVPCIPGYEGADQSDETLAGEAQKIGFPLMVKAAAGGGGRGMRLVEQEKKLLKSLATARSEAERSFGSGELILEKAILNPRHIEIQVFGDGRGRAVHLYERDCSIQRRHQKVIEEAPSPAVSPDLRERMGRVAAEATAAINYAGAGTFEFLLDDAGNFYFLEMNTRLQVEHPVTEIITDLDLVEWQIRIAAGEDLPLKQADIPLNNHAIEARLYAEDPYKGFLPKPGILTRWQAPEGPGMRTDHGLLDGVEVTPWYDAMIAKVIGHGKNREEARQNLIKALEQTVDEGLVTNRRFLIHCLEHPEFEKGAATTGFIEAHFPKDKLKELGAGLAQ
ncbi:MAG: acetyl-CoA carboxylase biotin carboxylase subunit [Alphaproteobacteria bacterium]|nr:MAG: acetyl-CoA carboxylase biotin carboxylase subunit [Alphaproteobacteria bacterium]